MEGAFLYAVSKLFPKKLGQSVLGTERLLRLLSLRALFRSKPSFGTSHLTAATENLNFSSQSAIEPPGHCPAGLIFPY